MHSSLPNNPIEEVRLLRIRLHSQDMTSDTKEISVRNLMTKLESIADEDEFSSCCAMMELWPIASELYMHDVCDGIGLWIYAKASIELINYVKDLDRNEFSVDFMRYWEDQISSSMTRNHQF